MTRDLQTDVRHYIAMRGPSTADEIARGIRARLADVRDELHHGPFFRTSPRAGKSGRGVHYDKLFVPSRRVPEPSSETDTDFLLRVLRDGAEHSLEDIIGRSQRERGYGLTVHSRASDLRKRGYDIQQRSVSLGRRCRSFYRLAGSLEEAAVGVGSLGPAASSSDPVAPNPRPSSSHGADRLHAEVRDDVDGILELFAAAETAPVRGAYSGEAA